MSKKKAGPKKRGPKGGIKHQPGRGHDVKSGRSRKKRFERLAEKKRQREQEEARRQWAIWDSLDDYVKKKRSDLKPEMPRPRDED